MANIILYLGSDIIYVQSIRDNWCSFHLECKDVKVKLGEEDYLIFAERLCKYLSEGMSEIVGSIDGKEVCWLHSFSESHCTLYASTHEACYLIFYQSAEGEVMWVSKMDKNAAAATLNTLTEFC